MIRRALAASLAFWLAVVPAWATPARVTGWFTDSAGPLTIATTAGDALCVFFAVTGQNAVTIGDNASGGSNTYTNVPGATNAIADGIYAYYVLNAKAATSLSITLSGETVLAIWVDEFSGVVTSSGLDGTGAILGATPVTTSGNWTTSTNGDVVCGIGSATNTTIAVGAGFTLGNDDHANANITEYLIQATASATTAVTLTGSPGAGAAAGFALKAAAGGATAAVPSLMLTGVGP